MGFDASFDESNEASSPHQPQDSEKLPKTSLGRAEVHWATDFHVVGVDIAQNCIRCWRERLVLAFERVASDILGVWVSGLCGKVPIAYMYIHGTHTHTHTAAALGNVKNFQAAFANYGENWAKNVLKSGKLSWPFAERQLCKIRYPLKTGSVNVKMCDTHTYNAGNSIN